MTTSPVSETGGDFVMQHLDQRRIVNRRKLGKRADDRRKVYYKLQTEQVLEKTALSEQDCVDYCSYIKKGSLSQFGIVKLSSLMLDATFSLHRDALHKPFFVDEIERRTTLLAYSVIMKQDSITAALLRGDIDPTRCIPDDCYGMEVGDRVELSRLVKRKMMGLYPAYTVYILQCFVQSYMRHSMEVRDGSSKSDDRECQHCNNKGGKYIVEVLPCCHCICSECYWRQAVLPIRSNYCDIVCPLPDCNCPLTPTLDPHPLGTEHDQGNENDVGEVRDGDHIQVATEVRQSSIAKWRLLPYDVKELERQENANVTSSGKKDKARKFRGGRQVPFCALSASQLCRHLMGRTRSQRNKEIHKVCTIPFPGQSARVTALVEAGCHIDVVNEYGQTPLLVAIYVGCEVDMVQTLLRAGADPNACDPIGMTALDVAESRRSGKDKRQVAELLLSYGARRGGIKTERDSAGEEEREEEGEGEERTDRLEKSLEKLCIAPCNHPTTIGTVVELLNADNPLCIHLPGEYRYGAYVLDDCLMPAFLDLLEGYYLQLKNRTKAGSNTYQEEEGSSKNGEGDDNKREHMSELDNDRGAGCDRYYFHDVTSTLVINTINNTLQRLLDTEDGDGDGVISLKKMVCSLQSRTEEPRSDGKRYNEQDERAVFVCWQGLLINTSAYMYPETTQPRSVPLLIMPTFRYLCYNQHGSRSAPHIDLVKAVWVNEGDANADNAQGADHDEDTDEDAIGDNISSDVHFRRSTHTFILYLGPCHTVHGGDTALLQRLPPPQTTEAEMYALGDVYTASKNDDGRTTDVVIDSKTEELVDDNVIVSVRPRRGRILIFPHSQPHTGRIVNMESMSPLASSTNSSHDNDGGGGVSVLAEGSKVLLRGEIYLRTDG